MPFYSEHRTVRAALAVERVTSVEIDSGARQRQVEAFERKAHAQSQTPPGAPFAQVLEDKQQTPPSPAPGPK